MSPGFFRRYLLPGFVFQSVVIAGGYGTGRELVEFFLRYGPLGGLLAMLLISTTIWSVVCMASFEFARMFRAFDYRSFFRDLLGPGWVLFEIIFFAMLLVVLAVIAATAGTLLQEGLGLPCVVGVISIVAAVGVLVFKGSEVIEKFLTGWSFLLYAVYAAILLLSLAAFGSEIGAALGSGEIRSGWWLGGIRYAGYSLAVIAAVLFTIRHAESRRHALIAGFLAGPIAILPGLCFYLAVVGQYPAVLDRAVPITLLLDLLGSRVLSVVFQVVLFGTLIETGTGGIHAVNERIAHTAKELGRVLPKTARPLVAILLLLMAALMSQLGLVDLIARGYGTITWAFLVVFVLPVLTWGVWKILRAGNALPPPPAW
jgi:uncharacterized membrane protein YkvI